MKNRKRPPVTLHQLRVFEAVAQHLSFTRAANELHLSQPTLSVQVRDLAQAVGLPLFEKAGRSVTLTMAGRELLATARSIFEGWERFQMAVADIKGMRRGALRVAAVTTATYFVPRLLGPFSEAYPGIELALEVARRDDVVERLIANRDDLYIMGVPPTDLAIHAHPVLANPLVIVAASGHALAKRRRLPLADMADEQFLFRERGSGTRMATERHFARHGFKPRVRMELGGNEAIKQAVASGFGVAVLSLHALEREPARAGLCVLDVAGFPIQRHWYAVYSKARPLSLVAQTFLEYMKKESAVLTSVDAIGRGTRLHPSRRKIRLG